ncbi:MAG: hemerythrin domain-containing protein, partial [Rhodospirillaceae bacterium]
MSVGFDDSLRVGHGQIDQEHQALVSLINEFLQNLVYKQDRNTLDLRYNAICEYAALHFSHEEELMRNNKFHDLCIHEKRHESLLTELRERSRFILGGTDDNLS